MRSTLGLLRPKTKYRTPSLYLPQPYQLFHESLLTLHKSRLSQETFNKETSPISGLDLFHRVTGLKTKAYVQSLWNSLSDAQKQAFQSPCPTILKNLKRLDLGYEKARLIADQENSRNPFFNSSLYPWEIIKDKLREKAAYAQDVYDQLIQEALTHSRKAAWPTLLHQNWLVHFRPEDAGSEEFHELPVSLRTKFILEASRKNDYARRKHQFRKAKKSHTKGFVSFESEYSEVIGNSMPEAEKAEFIIEQWEAANSITSNGKFKSNYVILREIRLETELAMVMDYIFEYGDVGNLKVDWRVWRNSVYGKNHYLHKTMFPYIVNVTKNKVYLHKSLPEHLEWQKPSLSFGGEYI